ncbi:hypothetical protein T10_7493 [Trichinella papuae]|uniref:Uncharacterized protein n=1 Tax=Trichinella papuae TaxID=268474 RepID=A0A0V1N0R6_9BILA|nr:hypothetical protein T10_7493 [Trichinella papuae]
MQDTEIFVGTLVKMRTIPIIRHRLTHDRLWKPCVIYISTITRKVYWTEMIEIMISCVGFADCLKCSENKFNPWMIKLLLAKGNRRSSNIYHTSHIMGL